MKLPTASSEVTDQPVVRAQPDGTVDAINALCSSSEQSYAQFMNNFITLTPADINPEATPAVSVIRPTPHLPFRTAILTSQSSEIKITSKFTEDKSNDLEEVLDEGTRVADVLIRKSGGSVQVDNFIEIDEDDAEGLDEATGYCASFTPAEVKKEPLKAPQPTGKELNAEKILERIRPSEDVDEDDLLDIIGEDVDPGFESNSDDEFQPDFYPEESHTIEKSHSEDGDSPYDHLQDLPNPGEVDEEEDFPRGKVHETQLGFSTLQRLSSGDVGSNADATDEVENFKLDDDFDYDHVVLSPKFPPEICAMMPGN